MEMDIDTLSNSFTLSVKIEDSWTNTTQYNIVFIDGKVIAWDYIPADTYLGHILGEYKYAQDIEIHSPYIIVVDDDYVIDGTKTPRSILTMVRHGYELGLLENCILYFQECEVRQDDEKIGFMTRLPIFPGEELIY